MIREVMEKGIGSLVARWMLQGSASALLDRVAAAGVLSPAELDKLRTDTEAHLRRVEAEGAPYADVALTALQEVAKVVPLAGVLTSAEARGMASKVGSVAAQVLAQSAAQAAQRVQEYASAAATRAQAAASPQPETAAQVSPVSDNAAATQPEA